jgi:hypothetical protein
MLEPESEEQLDADAAARIMAGQRPCAVCGSHRLGAWYVLRLPCGCDLRRCRTCSVTAALASEHFCDRGANTDLICWLA